MFGSSKAAAKGSTVLLLDIESGSVATAILRLTAQGPYLFAYRRHESPLSLSRSSENLFKNFDDKLAQALTAAAEVTARMRQGGSDLGAISHVAVFLSAPWGMPNLEAKAPTFADGILPHIQSALRTLFDPATVSFHTSADALATSAQLLESPDTLLAALRGELTELLLFAGGKVQAYGTVPMGSRSILRTLRTHGGFSEHEARSYLKLLEHQELGFEPLVASGEFMRTEFAKGASLLLRHGKPSSAVIVGERPLAEWLSKQLAEEESLVDLFASNATVEALKQHHFLAPLSASPVSDPFILAEATFVDARTKH